MLFAVICKDKPGHLEVRTNTRPDHLSHLKHLNESGTLKFAGPFLGDDGKPTGSLVVIEAADKQAARGIADSDPYAKAGLFASIEISAWNWSFNNPSAS